METAEQIKEMVREKYGAIAENVKPKSSGCCSGEVYFVGDSYAQVEGYVADADLGLGCGIPTEIAQLREGQTVLDLGSGAGNDVFVARRIVGESGRVIGVDMTAAMIERARANAEKLGYANVEFRLGEIENLPVEAHTADVVISNCVLNLVPDKAKAFAEIARVLKPGGHFSISDIVLEGELPAKVKHLAEAYAGCVAGALQKPEYLEIAERNFVGVRVAKEKEIHLPDEILRQMLDEATLNELQTSGSRLLSITVYGEKATGN
ncbi:MAG: arsenite methyltransferase [Acidobacteriota bacterium]